MSVRFALAVVLLSIGSCQEKEDLFADKLLVLTRLQSEEGLTYEQSLIRWKELKDLNGNSYVYQTTITSWTGMGHTTELKIENGAVTSRIYQEFDAKDDGSKEIVDSYTEGPSNLGAHSKGAAPLTIDDLYEMCAKEYLVVDEENNTVYFETSPDGILTLCGYTRDGCVDDCYNGIRINSFEWLNK